jgi:predicted CXXCH cytochrome family protein
MNPGFDSAHQPDFRRQIVYECLFCHTGYPEIAPGADGSGHEPLFTGRIPEGIDCQRCHGPGRAHIDTAASGALEKIRSTIVNPKRLALDRQLEVCMQCHLETTSSRLPHTILRFDRGALSYRPGTPLADFAIHFDHQPGSGHDDKFEIAHQAYRLRKSACFQKSDGRLTCTTCHNPHHAVRGEEAVRRYTDACRGCHGQQLSQFIVTGRHTAEANCVECHMPKRRPEDVVNVTMTDHYIQRRAPRRDPGERPKERQETEQTRYKGPVALYYPATLSSKPEDELYLAVAQVKQLNNLEEGIPKLVAALHQFPNAAGEFYFELAEAYGKTGKNDEAIRSYQTAIQRKPDFRPAWLGLGRSLSKAGKRAQAVEALEKAAAMGPEDATIQNDLGLSYLVEGRSADAVRAFQKAVMVDPEHSEAFDNLGSTLRESGNAAGAEQAYRSALRAQPDFTSARRHLANLLAVKGEAAEAGYHYQKAIAQDPQSAEIHAEYATALASAERYDQALAEFQAAARLDPKLAGAQLGLADILALKGQMDQAAGYYRRALALNADSGAAHLGLASALEAQGQHAEAILHLQKAAQSSDATSAQAAREALQSLTPPRP